MWGLTDPLDSLKLDPEVYTTRTCASEPAKSFTFTGVPKGYSIVSATFADPTGRATPMPATGTGTGSSGFSYLPSNTATGGACATGHVPVTATVTLNNPAGTTETKTVTAEIVLEAPAQGGGIFQRAIFGYEQAGASAAPTTPLFFLNFYVSQPLGKGNHAGFGPRLRSWVDSRITSVPSQSSLDGLSLGGLATSLTSAGADLKANAAVQGVEVLGGLQYRLFADPNKRKIFFNEGLSQTSLSFVVAYGGLTPLNPTTSAQAFEMPAVGSDALKRLIASFPNIEFVTKDKDGKETLAKSKLAFLQPDRQRFQQQYYAGFRIQSHFFDAAGKSTNTPMRSVDVLFGQNNAITADRFKGVVSRVEFFNPISLGGKELLYIFGSAIFRLGGAKAQAPGDAIILTPAATPGSLSSTDYRLITLNSSNRDLFRVGFGVNLSGVFNAAKKKQ